MINFRSFFFWAIVYVCICISPEEAFSAIVLLLAVEPFVSERFWAAGFQILSSANGIPVGLFSYAKNSNRIMAEGRVLYFSAEKWNWRDPFFCAGWNVIGQCLFNVLSEFLMYVCRCIVDRFQIICACMCVVLVHALVELLGLNFIINICGRVVNNIWSSATWAFM